MNFLYIILASFVTTIVWADSVALFAKVNNKYLPLSGHPYLYQEGIINYMVFRDISVTPTKFIRKGTQLFTFETSTSGFLGFDDEILAIGPTEKAIKWRFDDKTARIVEPSFYSCPLSTEDFHYLYPKKNTEICFKVDIYFLRYNIETESIHLPVTPFQPNEVTNEVTTDENESLSGFDLPCKIYYSGEHAVKILGESLKNYDGECNIYIAGQLVYMKGLLI